jgi:hypothetical protein
MRLGLFDRIRRLAHPRRSAAAPGNTPQGKHRKGQPGTPSRAASPAPGGWPEPRGRHEALLSATAPAPGGRTGPGGSLTYDGPAAPAPRAAGVPAVRAGAARARIREAPADVAAMGMNAAPSPVTAAPGPRLDGHDARTRPDQGRATAVPMPGGHADAAARASVGVPRQPGAGGRPSVRAAGAALRARLPFASPHPRERSGTADGRRNCGTLEAILWRQWDAAMPPPAEVVLAVDRLAELPERIKERLADGLDGIFVGPGGVPELDDMTALRGVRLPSGQASWDACAGAYGERKIVVGTQPSPTPDVVCHEVGHALDDLDSPPGKWQSDSAEFRLLYEHCQPHIASDFHRQPGGLGRKEFFADAFAAIASRQRPALVDMLSGDTRAALRVMLYFNKRYGI